jgi:hypothetical protein
MRELSFPSAPPPTTDPTIQWILERLEEIQRASQDNVFEAENIAQYAPIASPVFTGDPQAPTPAPGDNDTSIATTAFVTAADVAVATAADTALDAAIAQEVTDRNAAIAAAAYDPPDVANGEVLGRATGGPANPVAVGLSALIDAAIGSTRGAILERGASGWALLAPGTDGHYLKSNGAGADPSYADPTVFTRIFKSADQSISSNITPANLTDLSFAADASSIYIIRIVLFIEAGAGGYRMDMNTTSALTDGYRAQSGAGVPIDQDDGSSTAGDYLSQWFARIVTNGATTISVRGAQWASNAAATVFKKGSYLEYRKIA